jgi:hypothetical protein
MTEHSPIGLPDEILGTTDEYVSNQLTMKALKLRNEKLKDELLAHPANKGRNYLSTTGEDYYINVSEREVYQYSNAVTKLEVEMMLLRRKIHEQQEKEIESGKAKQVPSTKVLTVRPMTAEALERIRIEDALLAGGEDDL